VVISGNQATGAVVGGFEVFGKVTGDFVVQAYGNVIRGTGASATASSDAPIACVNVEVARVHNNTVLETDVQLSRHLYFENVVNLWEKDNAQIGTAFQVQQISVTNQFDAAVNGGLEHRSQAGTPVSSVTPLYVGEEFLNTSIPEWYKATALTSADWVLIG
jgi:hypothetical protein